VSDLAPGAPEPLVGQMHGNNTKHLARAADHGFRRSDDLQRTDRTGAGYLFSSAGGQAKCEAC